MSLAFIAFAALAFLFLGYVWYGRLIARRYALDDKIPTPAVQVNDGVDYVPTKPFYLLGQHFSAIAAAGPIAGPILACQQFGWLPCLLWIGLGVVFIGAVHDFSSLVASVRHKAGSVAEIMRENIGQRAWLFIMIFIWLALAYVIVAFTDITAGTFVGKSDELRFGDVRFNPGGAVAASAILYLALSVIMGLVQRRWNPPLWLLTLLFVPATLLAVWLGTQVSHVFVLDAVHPAKLWGFIILGYCLVASLVPVWSLLQPRGYLGGFILYMALFLGVIGIFFGGYEVKQEAFKAWDAVGKGGAAIPLFPFLFVTIACGACSGFHGLVCSGTTSKQIAKESDCKPVGFGAMLLEGFVAIIALTTIMMITPQEAAGLPPGTLYGNGIGTFLTLLIGKSHYLFAITFGAMAFSTFVFDTLDVATRLSRLIVQELFGWRSLTGKIGATLLSLVIPALILGTAQEGAYLKFWTVFGTSNQLLAALTLMGVSVWLARMKKPYWFTLLPMLFVMAVTLYALFLQLASCLNAAAQQGWRLDTPLFNGITSLVLAALALGMIAEGFKHLRIARLTQNPR